MNYSKKNVTSEDINIIFKDEIEEYFRDNAKKLHNMVDKVLQNLKFHDVDIEEYYSLSYEIFYGCLNYYDRSKPFKGFLYSCLYKKFCTDMTAKKRSKRCTKIIVKEIDESGKEVEVIKYLDDERLDRKIADDIDSITLGEIIPSKESIDTQFFGENTNCYSHEMITYLSRLSDLQKEVLRLISIGFIANEIIEELHITQKQYDDCYSAIHSYRNISILM